MITGIWDEFLSIIKEEAGSRVVDTWFKAVSFCRWDADKKTAYLQAPNQFVRDWICNNYMTLMQKNLQRLLHVDTIAVQFMHESSPEEIAKQQEERCEAEIIHPAVRTSLVSSQDASAGTSVAKAPVHRKWGSINRSYSFDTFIVGPSNSLAYAASYAVAENPGSMYNPLFIYGESGLGKTHLLHAIGNEIQKRNPKLKIVYQTTDRFVSEFIYAIRFDQMHKFQEKYRDIDVLLIDDVQFISNKEQTQEAFFHIFNALYEGHKQIVFSSDTYPHNIQGIAERLRSRLSWGLVTDIYAPPLETKIAILKKKADMHEERLDDDVAHFIASHTFSNIRELEGALVRVMAFASLTKQSIDIHLAKKVLIQTVAAQTPTVIELHMVVRCIEKYYGYTLKDLCSKGRNKDLSFARQVAMFLMKKTTDKSLRDIADYLGKRDHSTVMYSIEKIEERVERDLDFKSKIDNIIQEIMQ